MRIALIGSYGMLARKVWALAPPGSKIYGFDLPEFDLGNSDQVMSEIMQLKPQIIINCAAYTNVDGCESQENEALRVNGNGPGYLAAAALSCSAVLLHISTDYVFSGDKTGPYLETDYPAPLSAYGRSKLAGEEAILTSGLKSYFIVRTSWMFGPGGKNFVETILRLAAERDELRVVVDQVGSPTYTGDMARAIWRLLALPACDELYGIYNFSNLGACSWHVFAEAIIESARALGLPVKTQRVVPITTNEYPLPAPRPANSTLSKEKYLAVTGATIPHWQESLQYYLRERSHH